MSTSRMLAIYEHVPYVSITTDVNGAPKVQTLLKISLSPYCDKLNPVH